jgi:hypothetical protein
VRLQDLSHLLRAGQVLSFAEDERHIQKQLGHASVEMADVIRGEWTTAYLFFRTTSGGLLSIQRAVQLPVFHGICARIIDFTD